jgi:hypothetical protein
MRMMKLGKRERKKIARRASKIRSHQTLETRCGTSTNAIGASHLSALQTNRPEL